MQITKVLLGINGQLNIHISGPRWWRSDILQAANRNLKKKANFDYKSDVINFVERKKV